MGAQLQRRLARLEERRRRAGADQRSDPPADIWERFVARGEVNLKEAMARVTPPERHSLYGLSAKCPKLRAARRLLKDDTPEQEAADLEVLQQWAAANSLHPKAKLVPTPERQAWARGKSEMLRKALKEWEETTRP